MGLRESLRILRMKARESMTRSRLHIAGIFSEEAREKLRKVDEFKRRYGIETVGHEIYKQEIESLQSLLDKWSSHLEILRKLSEDETFLQKLERERGIKLDAEHKRILKHMYELARRNPYLLQDIMYGSTGFSHWTRWDTLKALPPKAIGKRGLLRFIAGKTPLFRRVIFAGIKDLPKAIENYDDLAKKGIPWRTRLRYLGLLGSGVEKEYYEMLDSLSGVIRWSPEFRRYFEGNKAVKLLETLAVLDEVREGKRNVERVINAGVAKHHETLTGEPFANIFYDAVLEKLSMKTGRKIKDFAVAGRTAERAKILAQLRDKFAEIYEKHLKAVNPEENKNWVDDLKNRVAEEFVKYLLEMHKNDPDVIHFVDEEGEKVVLKKIKERIRRWRTRKGGIPKEPVRIAELERQAKKEEISPQEMAIATEELQKKEAISAYKKAVEEMAPEIEAAVNGPLDVHLKDHLEQIIGETYEILPLSLKDKVAMIKTDDLYRKLFNELKAKGIRTNALRIKDPKMLDEITKELKAAIIAHVYSMKLEMPKSETLTNILQDIESKKSAINEWQERLAKAKNNEREYHEKRMAIAERIAEMLSEHVYANPNMKKELMKRIQEAAERDEVSKYLETFIEKSLQRIGKKTVKGTEKNIFEASLKRMMEELKTHEENIRAAKTEARRAELAIRNLTRDMQKAHQKLEAERKKLMKQQEEILMQYHRDLAKEIARILLERANKNHITFTTISRK